MCRLPVNISAVLVSAIAFAVVASSVGAAEYFGDSRDTTGWVGEFPPEGYNPYLPESSRPVQRIDQLPPSGYLQSPVYGPAQVVPQTAPLAPVSPVTPTLPEYYNPQAVPAPGVNPYSPGYAPPGLYSPAPGLYPGYFYPFNNSQFIAPFF